jgi:hypothetical protein
MIASVTHHDARYILWDMPLAQGLQYQAVWCEINGRTLRAPTAHTRTFSHLAG